MTYDPHNPTEPIHEIRIRLAEPGLYLDPRDQHGNITGRGINITQPGNLEQTIQDLFLNGPTPEPEIHRSEQ